MEKNYQDLQKGLLPRHVQFIALAGMIGTGIFKGSFLQYWFPSVPLWLLSFFCATVIVGINLFQVKYYGELEFWFAGVKILALTAFIILGILLLIGILPSNIHEPFSNYTAHGGFF